jgi:hypothetical protein
VTEENDVAHDDWAKMDARLDSHPKIRKGGRNARDVFLFALRRNRLRNGSGANGRLPAADFEPWYLADQLMIPEVDAVEGVARAIAADLLARDGGQVLICGFDEDWGGGRVPMTEAERKRAQRSREVWTYAIEQVGAPFIKIGRANNPGARLLDLQTGSPVELRIVAMAKVDIERELHEELAADSSGGEWFHRTERVMAVIMSRLSGQRPDTVTAPRDVRTVTEKRGEERRREESGEARAPRRRPTSMPADWQPNATHERIAGEQGVDMATERAKFSDHAAANDKRFADWDAAFRTWLRNAAGFSRGPRNANAAVVPFRPRKILNPGGGT